MPFYRVMGSLSLFLPPRRQHKQFQVSSALSSTASHLLVTRYTRAAFIACKRSGCCNAHVWAFAANLEWRINRCHDVARQLFDVGMKQFSSDMDYVLECVEESSMALYSNTLLGFYSYAGTRNFWIARAATTTRALCLRLLLAGTDVFRVPIVFGDILSLRMFQAKLEA